jgi:hypothetical protein
MQTSLVSGFACIKVRPDPDVPVKPNFSLPNKCDRKSISLAVAEPKKAREKQPRGCTRVHAQLDRYVDGIVATYVPTYVAPPSTGIFRDE